VDRLGVARVKAGVLRYNWSIATNGGRDDNSWQTRCQNVSEPVTSLRQITQMPASEEESL